VNGSYLAIVISWRYRGKALKFQSKHLFPWSGKKPGNRKITCSYTWDYIARMLRFKQATQQAEGAFPLQIYTATGSTQRNLYIEEWKIVQQSQQERTRNYKKQGNNNKV
jgi:hypothetical protein